MKTKYLVWSIIAIILIGGVIANIQSKNIGGIYYADSYDNLSHAVSSIPVDATLMLSSKSYNLTSTLVLPPSMNLIGSARRGTTIQPQGFIDTLILIKQGTGGKMVGLKLDCSYTLCNTVVEVNDATQYVFEDVRFSRFNVTGLWIHNTSWYNHVEDSEFWLGTGASSANRSCIQIDNNDFSVQNTIFQCGTGIKVMAASSFQNRISIIDNTFESVGAEYFIDSNDTLMNWFIAGNRIEDHGDCNIPIGSIGINLIGNHFSASTCVIPKNGKNLKFDHNGNWIDDLQLYGTPFINNTLDFGGTSIYGSATGIRIGTNFSNAVLQLYRNVNSATSGILEIKDDHASSAVPSLKIRTDGTGYSVTLDSDFNTKVWLGQGAASTEQRAGYFYRNLAAASTSKPVVTIEQTKNTDDQVALELISDGSSPPLLLQGNITGQTCNAANEGGIYYNDVTNKHYGCDGTNWNAFY